MKRRCVKYITASLFLFYRKFSANQPFKTAFGQAVLQYLIGVFVLLCRRQKHLYTGKEGYT